jgi:phosphomethylpyrimidine synthase
MATQVDSAKNNHITRMMEQCAQDEGVSTKDIQKSLIEGTAVLPANRNHTSLQKPIIIGKPYRVKINANIGTSHGFSSKEEELMKLKVCLDSGADAVMDLSTWGDLDDIRQEILQQSLIPVGSVPIYSTAVKAFSEGKKVIDFEVADFLEMIELHAKSGIDFITLHAGVTQEVVRKCKESSREMKMVSRGGSILAGWMIANNKENPLYTHFDEILSIAQCYDVTLSLGDGLRPGSILDSTDSSQVMELVFLAELVERARKANVQVMVEGPGHIPIDQIQANVQLEKSICKKAPFFVLGPIVTDIAPGYDHIVSAIGGALAAYHGADFLCYVTPAEHLCLPDLQDVKEGIMASRIAAHAADLCRGNGKAWEIEKTMGIARGKLDWEGQFQVSIDPDLAKKRFHGRKSEKTEGCSMCGPFCALKSVRDYMMK